LWPWSKWIEELGKCTASPDDNSSTSPWCAADNEGRGLAEVGQPGGTRLTLFHREFWAAYSDVLASTPIQTLKALLAWKLMYTTSICLSSDYIDLMAGLRGELSGGGEMEHFLTDFNSTLPRAKKRLLTGQLPSKCSMSSVTPSLQPFLPKIG
jgi:hypothetical protein